MEASQKDLVNNAFYDLLLDESVQKSERKLLLEAKQGLESGKAYEETFDNLILDFI